ncbi:uncharacterized protein LOC123879876 [Maniola jurtina]|uniref:uncharacterized protein LOC123879876 n=1 Tax=Maniola jurtina TaxID=191418 RepID=UPI001E68ABD2|nr:uncharacterized protein LOC123879876 [Maniola jurtina]
MREYADLKHLSVYDKTPSESSFYLPHHPVLKLTSESTKIRVVYDASARTTSGFSVNDLQMVGPNIQDSLFNILVRFRQHKYVLSADIEKMYRSILVDESDRDLQLILWREQESQPLMTLQLNTVTYGFSSSSFLSTRCLWQCGEECGDSATKTVIQNDFYADDLLTGTNTEDELCHRQRSVSDALAAGGFRLRKYRSNSKLVKSSIVQESSSSKEQESNGGTLTISNATSTLGIGWTSSSDELSFPVKNAPTDVVTKRTILSSTFKVFDPLGLLSLCTVIPKIMIQGLWSETKLGWDDRVPPHIESDWSKFIKELESISCLHIPRQALIDDPIRVEMHCFCDASEQAYGACIYLKSHNNKGEVQVHLLCAKSRVAPIKRQTIPRLELCGALLGAQLASTVTQALRCQIDRHVYWTDSKVVLGWLQTAKTPKTFVANRVAAIIELSEPSSWRYVPTSQNPADLVSRGVQPSCVNQCKLWGHGTNYLLEPEASWPAQEHRIKNLPEIKALAVEAQEPFFDLTRISRFPILQRIYAWVLRCINNVRKSKNRLTGLLQSSELDNSMCAPVKISQGQSFANELTLLSSNKQFKASSLLSSLDTVIDAKGILRVGGHLSMSDFNYDKKCPILLYADSHLTKILFYNERDRLKSGEFQDSVQNFVSKQNIEFEFSLVYALNFSGLWEAGTKATKFHPKGVMCTSNLTFEELSSLFAQVESILNSRPLCPLSPSPNDLQCLTPGHFLIGRPLMSLPSPPLLEINTNQLDRFQRLEQAHQHFWKRWANVYVAELQKRTKWRTRCTTLKVHDLVLLKEPSAPPLCWRLSRVTQLHPSADDVPRVADISTAQGIVRRALNQICLLPTSCS